MAQDDRIYQIIIKDETTGGGGKGGSGKSKSKGGSGSGSKSGTAKNAVRPKSEHTQSSSMLSKFLRRTIGVGALMSYANQEISYQIRRVELLTGDKEQAQRANYVYSKASSVANAFAVGLVSSGGNIAVAGVAAAASALHQAISTGIEIAHERDTANIRQRIQDYTQDLRSQRATYSGSRYQNAGMGN